MIGLLVGGLILGSLGAIFGVIFAIIFGAFAINKAVEKERKDPNRPDYAAMEQALLSGSYLQEAEKRREKATDPEYNPDNGSS